MDAIPNEKEREELTKMFTKTGKEIIILTKEQVDLFAGNILELTALDGEEKIIMSKTAHDSLDKNQIASFSTYGAICTSPVPTIEQIGGGGIRCLLAELFLKPL